MSEIVGDTITLTYFAGRSDIQYVPQHSSNLADWKREGIIISARDSKGFRTASYPRGTSEKFLRIKVTQNAAP